MQCGQNSNFFRLGANICFVVFFRLVKSMSIQDRNKWTDDLIIVVKLCLTFRLIFIEKARVVVKSDKSSGWNIYYLDYMKAFRFSINYIQVDAWTGDSAWQPWYNNEFFVQGRIDQSRRIVSFTPVADWSIRHRLKLEVSRRFVHAVMAVCFNLESRKTLFKFTEF